MAAGRHFAVIRAAVEHLRPARFDEEVEIKTALRWIRGASAAFGYEVRRERELLAQGSTEHVLVDERGRPRRIPQEWREQLKALAAE
jgi:acyl-CoA thioester hydrolase